MKIPVIIIPQSRLFLRFCVRMLCCQVFLVSVFISSQTLFSGSDSIIYISEEASVYADSHTLISVTAPVGIEPSGGCPTVYHKAKILKSTLKTAPATVYTTYEKGSSFCFTAPAGSQQFSNPGGFCSQAVTGNFFSRKLLMQVISPGLLKLHGIMSSKEKPFGLAFYPIRVIKISLQQYSRPPPVI
ncbi:hypothetical protein [Chryseobacterium taichungense]|nr:hypothetical protein [Chryseobacterium taichungense]